MIFAIFTGVFISTACVFCSINVLTLLFLGVAELGCQKFTITSLQEIEDVAHVKFVPSTANATLYSQDGCKSIRHFFVQFQMASSDLNTFLASTRADTSSVQTTAPETFSLVPSELGWRLDSVKFWLVDKHPNSLDYQQSIGVDMSDPDQYTIYLVVKSYD